MKGSPDLHGQGPYRACGSVQRYDEASFWTPILRQQIRGNYRQHNAQANTVSSSTSHSVCALCLTNEPTAHLIPHNTVTGPDANGLENSFFW